MSYAPLKTHVLYTVLSSAFIFMFPVQAAAWGDNAHRIIALIATERLSPAARQNISSLLNGKENIVSVAPWADHFDRARGDNLAKHYVDIPLNKPSYSSSRDCGSNNCLVEALKKNIEILRSPRGSKMQRAEALKYVVHLVGDAHQPLHCADNGDYGGQTLKIVFFGQETNLHSLWDSSIIARANLSEEAYAQLLSKKQQMSKGDNGAEGGTVVDWVNESHRLARYAYETGGGNVGDAYYRRSRAVIEDQLLKAGVRLAKVLNESLK
jgi:hypothetical protein